MLFQLQLRVFYSLHDSRTPAIIGGVTMIFNVAVNYVALAVLQGGNVVVRPRHRLRPRQPGRHIVARRILSLRLRGLDGRPIGRTLVRMHVATLPAAILAVSLVGLLIRNPYTR